MSAKSSGDLHARVAVLAQKQGGNVSRVQLLACGSTSGQIRSWLACGRLLRVHRGVFAVGRMPVTPLEWAWAAVLACGEGALISHRAALRVWGVGDRWPRVWDVTLPTGDRRPKGISVHQVRSLAAGDVTRQLGVPVTSLARTVLDCAPSTPPERLGRLVNDALLTAYLTETGLLGAIGRYPLHPGGKLVRAHLFDARTRSVLEDRFLAFCRAHGLPEPEVNVTLAGREVDALFAAEKLIVELDGWEFHRHRRNFREDRRRDTVAAVDGYLTVRITDDRLTGEEAGLEAARLRAILRQRRPAA